MTMQADRPAAITLLSLAFLCMGGSAKADTVGQVMVADKVPLAVLEQDLVGRRSLHLGQMIANPDKRREYVWGLYADQGIESAIIEQGLAQNQELLEELRNARTRLLVEALVQHEMEKSETDIDALARERYSANRDQYLTRKKIKLAIIYIEKVEGKEQEARGRMDDVFSQLGENPGNIELFKALARKYSDDKQAQQGGVNENWLIAPTDLDNRDALVQAAFAMDTVGQLTDIVETPKGFAIATLMAVTPALPVSFDAAKDGIVRQIQNELYQRIKMDVLQSVKAPDDLEINDALVQQKIGEAYRARRAAAGAVDE